MGELRQRGRVWWIRYYRNGRRYEESSKSTTKRVAADLLKIREGDIAHGMPVRSGISRFRFEDAARALIADYTANGRRSLDEAQRRIRIGLEPWFRRQSMAEIGTDDVVAYAASRREGGVANATINYELALLKRMFTLALRAGRLLHRPHIPLLQENNVRQGFFEREQFEAVRRHLPAYVRGLVTFAYVTGWRTRSEIQPLQWAQVDRQAWIVRLEPGTTKNREARTFHIQPIDELREVLADQWAQHTALRAKGIICPWVFQRAGTQIKGFRKAWVTACKKTGCPGRIPHDFRRTAVRNLVRAGVPERVAMQMTGHKTRSVFERYNIVSDADLKDASQRLDRFQGGLGA